MRGKETAGKVALLEQQFDDSLRSDIRLLDDIEYDSDEETDRTRFHLRTIRMRMQNNVKARLRTNLSSEYDMIIKFIRDKIQDEFVAARNKVFTDNELALLETRMNIVNEIKELMKRLLGKSQKHLAETVQQSYKNDVMLDTVVFLEWLFDINSGLTEQQSKDIETELDRLSVYVDCALILNDVKVAGLTMDPEDDTRLSGIYKKLLKKGKLLSQKEIESIRLL